MKKKIHKYDFLIIGAGLIGSLAALALHKKKFKVLKWSPVDPSGKVYEQDLAWVFSGTLWGVTGGSLGRRSLRTTE